MYCSIFYLHNQQMDVDKHANNPTGSSWLIPEPEPSLSLLFIPH